MMLPLRVFKMLVAIGLACLLIVLWVQLFPAGGSEPRVDSNPRGIRVVTVDTPNGEVICVTVYSNGIDCDWGER